MGLSDLNQRQPYLFVKLLQKRYQKPSARLIILRSSNVKGVPVVAKTTCISWLFTCIDRVEVSWMYTSFTIPASIHAQRCSLQDNCTVMSDVYVSLIQRIILWLCSTVYSWSIHSYRAEQSRAEHRQQELTDFFESSVITLYCLIWPLNPCKICAESHPEFDVFGICLLSIHPNR